MSGEIAACCCRVRTSALSRSCSSSQRRRSSSRRACRSRRASWYVANPPPWTHGAASLDGDDPLGGPGQQLAVVADEEHRLAGLGQLLLQPALAGDVEVVVRLVEQEHLVGAAQQRLEHQPLLLAAGQRGHSAPLGPDPGGAQAPPCSRCPRAPRPRTRPRRPSRRAPARSASWAGSSSRSIMASSAASTAWAAARIRAGATESSRSRTVLSSRTLPTNCRITPRPAAAHHGPGRGGEVPGDDPQQRRLARAVGADQGHHGALAHPERHVVEQHASIRKRAADRVDLEVPHSRPSWPTRGA